MDDDDKRNQIVRKTYFPPSSPPQTVPEMTPEQQKPWDNWIRTRINTALDDFATQLGEEVAVITKGQNAKLEKLSDKITELQKEVVEVRIANAYERGKNAGVVIDLPVLPSRKQLDA